MLTTPEENEDHQKPKQFNHWNPIAAIFRCWRWALPVGVLLAAITATTLVFTHVPSYRASYLLTANHDFVVFKGVIPVVKNPAKSERALILSPIVLDPVLSEPGIRSAPSLSDPTSSQENLLNNLSIESAGTDSVMSVSYEDTDPDSAAMVCNAIVESYLRQRDAFDRKRVSNLEDWLEPEIQTWELEVSEKQRSVESLNKVTQGYFAGDLAAKAQLEGDLEFQGMLRTRIGEVSLEIEIIDAKIAVGESESTAKSKSGDAESQLEGERSGSKNEIRRERELLSAELEVLKKRLLEEKSKLEPLRAATVELQFAQDELKIASEILSKLRWRLAEIRTERRQNGAVRPVAPATTPKLPYQPFPIRKTIWASALAFLAPFLLGFLLGFVPARNPEELPMESVD